MSSPCAEVASLDRWLVRAVTTRATVSVSQPFVTLPSQSPNPTKQVVLQTPAAHVPPAPGAGGGHTAVIAYDIPSIAHTRRV